MKNKILILVTILIMQPSLTYAEWCEYEKGSCEEKCENCQCIAITEDGECVGGSITNTDYDCMASCERNKIIELLEKLTTKLDQIRKGE